IRSGMGSRTSVAAVAALGAALLAGGCGGSAKLASNQIAVVCGEPVTRAQFDELIQQGHAVYKLQHQPFPAVGTARYATIKRHVLQLLVQHAEQREAAAKMGIHVTDAQIAASLRQQVAAQFHGDAKAFERAAAKQGLTPQAMRVILRSNL